MRIKLLTSWLVLMTTPALAQNLNLNPESLLDRASRALQSTDYYGTLTYEFGSALRHFLRHDPDVILLGEMRDAETAQAALEAAATGHLVLSTLHVTTVFGVVPRLRPLGIEAQVIADNLLAVGNQRPGAETGYVFVDPDGFVADRDDERAVRLGDLHSRAARRGWTTDATNY